MPPRPCPAPSDPPLPPAAGGPRRGRPDASGPRRLHDPVPPPSPAQPDPTRTRTGTSLRGVAGGYDITRWPIAVPPAPGEHPASWLWRGAHRYGMTPSATLTALGIRPVAASPPRIEQHLRAHAQALTAHLGPYHAFTDEEHGRTPT